MKSSNIFIKTIIFILVVALTSLIFFGLGNSDKTNVELVSFGFITFAELVVYLTLVTPSFINLKKLSSSDFTAIGALYFISSVILNIVFLNEFNDVKTLVIYNVIEIIIFLILFCSLSLRKK